MRTGSLRVLPVALIVVALAQLLRWWALQGAFFDPGSLGLLDRARRAPVGGDLDALYLDQPAPGAWLLTRAVGVGTGIEWDLAVAVLLGLSSLAALALLWMLVEIFGRTPQVLVLLVIALVAAPSAVGLLWWSTAIMMLPVQAAACAAIACWARYLRTGADRWALASTAFLLTGLAFGVLGILAAVVLAGLSVWFRPRDAAAAGRAGPRRLRRALRAGAHPTAAIVGYLAWHRSLGAELSWPGWEAVVDLAESMVGTSLATLPLGGPWRWGESVMPTSVGAPPTALVHLGWVIATLVVTYTLLRRLRAGRAWGLLAAYLGLTVLVVALTRPLVDATLVGSDHRLLGPATDILVLCVGLALLPHRDGVGSRTRTEPLLLTPVPRAVTIGLTLLIVAGGLTGTVRSANSWHESTATRTWFDTVAAELSARGRTDLADSVVPDFVVPSLAGSATTTGVLAPLASPLARFPDESPALHILDDSGQVRRALVTPGITSVEGPVPDCGWRVAAPGATIPLSGSVLEGTWWMRIGYLSGEPADLDVGTSADIRATSIESGLNSLYLKVQGPFDSVRLDGLAPGAGFCVDIIEIGLVVPGGSSQ